jgi:hypothetical protein
MCGGDFEKSGNVKFYLHTVAYGHIEGYNVHAYSHMDSISYTIPA